jgi:hypothetical protein
MYHKTEKNLANTISNASCLFPFVVKNVKFASKSKKKIHDYCTPFSGQTSALRDVTSRLAATSK